MPEQTEYVVGVYESERPADLERRLLETIQTLWTDNLVDPSADLLDPTTGERWLPLGTGKDADERRYLPRDEGQLAQVRADCRLLADTNEFAINGHENRISYIVGSGHTYTAAVKDAPTAARKMEEADGALPDVLPTQRDSLAAKVQAVLDEFVRLNHWQQRQQEIVRRKDRDGECFLRFFADTDGMVRVRFVEPSQVATPTDQAGKPGQSWGIQTDPDDVETVTGYWIDGKLVDAAEVQHRKANVDANVKRGLPLYFPVRKNLRRAEKLLRNMSVVAEIQSAIAIIRKHATATKAGVEQFVTGQANKIVSNDSTGATRNYQRFGAGTILDSTKGIDYEFPAAGIDAARYVTVLQAELRAIASRLVMPEFMLSSDASNANYSSTMVAEGPAVKMFQREQFAMVEDDVAVMDRVIEAAVEAGKLPANTAELIEVQATPPNIQTRDRLKDAQADFILQKTGAISAQTIAERNDLDWGQEKERLADEQEAADAQQAVMQPEPGSLDIIPNKRDDVLLPAKATESAMRLHAAARMLWENYP